MDNNYNPLNPEIHRDGHHRINPINEKYKSFHQKQTSDSPKSNSSAGAYVEEDIYDDEDDSFDVVELPNKTFQVELSVPSPLYGYIIGRRGAVINKLRADSKTNIYVPKGHRSEEKVVISGASRKNVCATARKVNQIVADGRRNMKPTHFVNIPLNIAPIKDKYMELKKLLTEDQRFAHIDESLFQVPELLHLTLAVFPLLCTEERLRAVETLQKCEDDIKSYIKENCRDGKVPIHVKGVDIFSDEDGSAVNVVFAKVIPECREVQEIANIISKRFNEAGISVEKKSNSLESVKLHCTMINTNFAKRVDNENLAMKFKKRPEKFNASKLLEEFGDFDFSEIELKEIHISQMKTRGSDGYYENSSILKIV